MSTATPSRSIAATAKTVTAARSKKSTAPAPLTAADALVKILAAVKPLPAETVPLAQALGRTLRQNVLADRPLPPFDRAAMDGYALRCANLRNGAATLTSVGIVPAGARFTGKIAPGQCVRIMTGGSVPAPCDLIVPIEECTVTGDRQQTVTVAPRTATPWHHIHRCGSDARQKQILLPTGHPLRPVDIATLAAVGCAKPRVGRKIRVGLVATGREIVPIAQKPRPEQIRESNGTNLAAILNAQPWLECAGVAIAPDQPGGLAQAFRRVLKTCDVLLTTGGVSAGDFDLVPQVLADLGVKRVFHKLKIKPGKPLWFGLSRSRQPVFGLPGNPVSTLTTFHEFVLPALRKLAGRPDAACRPYAIHMKINVEHKKKTPLLEFARARFFAGTPNGCAKIVPASATGSGDFYSLTQSDGIMVLPEDTHDFPAFTRVEFHPWKFD